MTIKFLHLVLVTKDIRVVRTLLNIMSIRYPFPDRWGERPTESGFGLAGFVRTTTDIREWELVPPLGKLSDQPPPLLPLVGYAVAKRRLAFSAVAQGCQPVRRGPCPKVVPPRLQLPV